MILTHLAMFSFFYGAGTGAIPPPVTTTTTQPSGVSKGRVIHLSDLSPDSRQSTADYIKARMNLPVFEELPPEKIPVYKAGRKSKKALERERLAEEARIAMEIEAQDEIRILRNNNTIIAIIMMANQ